MAVGLGEAGSAWSVELNGAGIEIQSGTLQVFDFCFITDQNRFGLFAKLSLIEEKKFSRLSRRNCLTSEPIFLYFSCRCSVGLAFSFLRMDYFFFTWWRINIALDPRKRIPASNFLFWYEFRNGRKKVSFQRFQSTMLSDVSDMVEGK